MKALLAITLLTVSAFSFAQTDIIEMRSRNTSLKNYERSLSAASFYHVPSNFGAAPTMLVKSAVLDSVKSISDSATVMYTSNYCWRAPRTRELIMEERNRQNGQGPEKRYQAEGIGDLWQPGADTIVNHPLFMHVHSLDSVKSVIDKDYYFNLPSDSIEFIGFDNEGGQLNQQEIKPTKIKNQKKNSFGWELIFMLVTPVLFLFAMSKLIYPKTNS
jgi:hypothetical protein